MKTGEITKKMDIDSNPFFRRIITPWYDSNTACWTVIIFMVPLLFFAITGLKIALTTPDSKPHIWVPSLLTGLSCFIVSSTATRMIKRHKKG